MTNKVQVVEIPKGKKQMTNKVQVVEIPKGK